ncbi:MAG: PKD domain-containing protein, partial [Chloroflexaceae bacterium]|nr:PKD domain-containing protein [Chloroflexaceae bacterium]
MPPIQRANVPPIAADPVDAALISTTGDASAITLNIPELVPAPLTLAANDPTPLGNATALTATLTIDTTYAAYTWDLGDGTVLTNEPTGAITHTYQAPGVYTVGVTATTNTGVAYAATVVEVDDTLTGLTVANSSPTVLGSATVFTATLAGGSNATFTWSFGDGSAPATGANPSYTYPRSGFFTATVTARNAVGTQTASTAVTVFAAGQGTITPEHGGIIRIGTGDEEITAIFPAGVVTPSVVISLTREVTPLVAFNGPALRVLTVRALDSAGNLIPNFTLQSNYSL